MCYQDSVINRMYSLCGKLMHLFQRIGNMLSGDIGMPLFGVADRFDQMPDGFRDGSPSLVVSACYRFRLSFLGILQALLGVFNNMLGMRFMRSRLFRMLDCLDHRINPLSPGFRFICIA